MACGPMARRIFVFHLRYKAQRQAGAAGGFQHGIRGSAGLSSRRELQLLPALLQPAITPPLPPHPLPPAAAVGFDCPLLRIRGGIRVGHLLVLTVQGPQLGPDLGAVSLLICHSTARHAVSPLPRSTARLRARALESGWLRRSAWRLACGGFWLRTFVLGGRCAVCIQRRRQVRQRRLQRTQP